MRLDDEGRQLALRFRDKLYRKHGGHRFVLNADGENLHKVFCLAVGGKRCEGIVCISADDLAVLVLTMEDERGRNANSWLERAIENGQNCQPGPAGMASVTCIDRKFPFHHINGGFVKMPKIQWVLMAIPGVTKALESDLVDPDIEEKIGGCF
jgi:hypothetical protein